MRYYDPKTGRFLQPDPIGYGDGFNLYRFVGNSPTNATDPMGLAADGSMLTSDVSAAAGLGGIGAPGASFFDPMGIGNTSEFLDLSFFVAAKSPDRWKQRPPSYIKAPQISTHFKPSPWARRDWRPGDPIGLFFMDEISNWINDLLFDPSNIGTVNIFTTGEKGEVYHVQRVWHSWYFNRIKHELGVGYIMFFGGDATNTLLAGVVHHENDDGSRDSQIDRINNYAAIERAKAFSTWESYAQSVLTDAFNDARKGIFVDLRYNPGRNVFPDY